MGREKPLVCTDHDKYTESLRNLGKLDVSDLERDIHYFMKITNIEGFEFVLRSNFKIKTPIELPSQVFLYPCFIYDTVGHIMNDPYVIKSFQMERNSQFIYDGWIPISSKLDSSIKMRIRELNESLQLLSFIFGVEFSWEPKYPSKNYTQQANLEKKLNLENLAEIMEKIKYLNFDDKNALTCSISWYVEGINSKKIES